tara:strand:+ start:259 stop:1464 length:1206 start_codon:yes stop_codon:yes gene_type:complete
MKIIIFTENNRGGGMDTFIGSLINNWPKKEDTFTVICNQNHPGITYLANLLTDDTKLVKHAIPLNWSLGASLLSILPFIAQRALRQLFRVLLSPIQYFLIKNLLRQENGDHLFSVNGGYPGGETCRLANIAWKKLNKTQSVHNIHNFAINYRRVFSIYETFMDKQLEASCSHIVAVSKACADSLSIRPVFSKSNKIIHIYNGLDDNSKLPVKKGIKDILNIRYEETLLVMIGTFEERKGHEFLLKAMSYVYQKHPNVHLAIIGGGSEPEILRVKEHIEKYTPNKNIYLPGFIDDVQQVLKGADMLLIPSQEFESFGLTALEAMLHGIPVVSTDTGGLPETIGENLVTGFYSTKDNYELYSKNISYLLDNKEISIKIGINGNRRAKKLFSSSRMSQNYHDLI